MAEYRINYNQVIRQARKIKELSGDLDREIVKLENTKNAVSSGWDSPASREFLKQLDRLIGDMKNTKKDIVVVSNKIKSVARSIKEADERQAELAERISRGRL